MLPPRGHPILPTGGQPQRRQGGEDLLRQRRRVQGLLRDGIPGHGQCHGQVLLLERGGVGQEEEQAGVPLQGQHGREADEEGHHLGQPELWRSSAASSSP